MANDTLQQEIAQLKTQNQELEAKVEELTVWFRSMGDMTYMALGLMKDLQASMNQELTELRAKNL